MTNDMRTASGDRPTSVERQGDVDLFVTRVFAAEVERVYAAWTKPALFMRWWAPRSMGATITDARMDVRTSGSYQITFAHPSSPTGMTFYGRYLEVIANERLVWTNDEGGDGHGDGPGDGGAVTTVTFTPRDGATLLILHDRYPTKDALDQAYDGMDGAFPEQFSQLDALLAYPAP
jgi:uncharacterized protein YndB with AHSA1/START domain